MHVNDEELAIDVGDDHDPEGVDEAEEEAATAAQPASRKNSVVYTPGHHASPPPTPSTPLIPANSHASGACTPGCYSSTDEQHTLPFHGRKSKRQEVKTTHKQLNNGPNSGCQLINIPVCEFMCDSAMEPRLICLRNAAQEAFQSFAPHHHAQPLTWVLFILRQTMQV